MGSAADAIMRAIQNQTLSGKGLGIQPNPNDIRRGADSLPSRQLGGQIPMHNLIMSPGRQGSTWWENQTYEMERLADQERNRYPVQGPPNPQGPPTPTNTPANPGPGYQRPRGQDNFLALLESFLNNRSMNGR